jgi:hypothetical protein
MSFTLRNQPAEAWNEVGSSFGKGLGNELISYIENKQFNKSLEGVTPQTPINEVLQRFAQNRVSPEQQQRWLQSSVQQSLSRERGKSKLAELGNMSKEEWAAMSMPQMIAKIAEFTQEAPPGTLENIFPALVNEKRADLYRDSRGQGGNQTSRQQPMQAASNQQGQQQAYQPQSGLEGLGGMGMAVNAAQGLGQNQGQGSMPSQGAQGQNQRQQGQLFPEVAKEGAFSNAGRGFQDMPTYDDDLQYALSMGQDFESAVKYAQDRDVQRNKIRESEVEAEEALDKRLEKGGLGPDKLDPRLRDFAVEYNRYVTGTANERANKTYQSLDRIQNAARNIESGTKRSWWDALTRNDLDGFYDREAGLLRSTLKTTEVPAAMQKPMLDFIQEAYSRRGDIGEIGIEEITQRAINPNYKKEIAGVAKLPKYVTPYEESIKRGGKFENDKDYEKAAKKNAESQPKVIDYLFKTLTRDSMSSPLLLRKALLDRNYDNEAVLEAFAEAESLGWIPSIYQKDQYESFRTPQNEPASQALRNIPGIVGKLVPKKPGLRSIEDQFLGIE